MEDFSESLLNLDMEQVISEIRERPLLYNNIQPKVKGEKDKLWEEVCENVVPNWEELSTFDKSNADRSIRSKWKNVRDNYKRQIEFQKMENLKGKPNKRRRRYIYFNHLSFLKPYMTEKDRNRDSADLSPAHTSNTNKSRHAHRNVLDRMQDETPPANDHLKDVTYFEEKMINIMESFQRKDIDEDESFLMSLLPSFKKFDDGQKYAARIEILGVLRRVKLRKLEIL